MNNEKSEFSNDLVLQVETELRDMISKASLKQDCIEDLYSLLAEHVAMYLDNRDEQEFNNIVDIARSIVNIKG